MSELINKAEVIEEGQNLFVDDWASSTQLLTEDISGSKPIILQGKMQHGGVKNGNGRVYLDEFLGREVKRLQAQIKARKLYGELDHPSVPIISYKNASHIIIEAEHKDDGQVIGKYQILRDHPSGLIVRSILKEEGCIATSSRALGKARPAMFKNETASVIGSDMKMITWDLVIDNSTPGCDDWTPINESMINYIGESMNKDSSKLLERKIRAVTNRLLNQE